MDVLWLRKSTYLFFKIFPKLAQFAFVLFAALTLSTFLLIEMRVGMWSELRAGCVILSAHKSNDGLAIVMPGELLTVGVMVGKSSFRY